MLTWGLALLLAAPFSIMTFRWLFPESQDELWRQGLMVVLEHFLGLWLYTWAAVKLVLWLLLSAGYGVAAYQLLRLVGL